MKSKRWLEAQKAEKEHRDRMSYSEEQIEAVKERWNYVLSNLPEEIKFDGRILDVGSAGSSVFLVINSGKRYVVDPTLDYIFRLNPDLKKRREYKGVKFFSQTLEDFNEDKFNVIFILNVIDHVDKIEEFMEKADSLLAKGGYMVLWVDLFRSRFLRNMAQFCDCDLNHPHHLMKEDVDDLCKGLTPLRFMEVKMVRKKKAAPAKKEPLLKILGRYIKGMQLRRLAGAILMTLIIMVVKEKDNRYTGIFVYKKP